MANTPCKTSPILDCLTVDCVPLIQWIQLKLDNLQAQINQQEADINSIKAQLAALAALVASLQACCQDYHKPLTLTHHQDVTNRTTFDAANQVLNLPPPIMAQILSGSATNPLEQAVPDGGVLTTLNHVFPDFETVAGMNAPGVITIPKTGRYRVLASWSCNTDEPDPAQGYSIGLTIGLNGATPNNGLGRFTAPLINLRAEQVVATIPAFQLNAGDQLSLLAFTDFPGGVTAYGAYLYVEYLELP